MAEIGKPAKRAKDSSSPPQAGEEPGPAAARSPAAARRAGENPVDAGPIVHEYDGILEADNQLPRWWLGGFFASILFAALYWTAYEGLKTVPYPGEVYTQEAAEIASAEAAKAQAAPLTDALLLGMSQQPAAIGQGKETYSQVCVACHGPNAGGLVGPNLTDAYWLHGSKPQDLYRVVKNGVLEKGMPSWGPQLGEGKVRSVVAYVWTLRNQNVPAGKAPQGELATP